MTTKLTDKNISNVANLGIQWQAVITADGSTATTAVAGRGYLIDTTSNAHTINLPASAIAGDTIAIKDYAGTFGTNNLTISRNGSNIQGAANDSLISSARASLELVYVNSTRGWVYTNESNVADLEEKLYVTATGGTITTSSDYKIHTFTGDGCFVVSCAGNPAGSTAVDYLVVAGGGAGGAFRGGGGAGGGFRESHSTPVSGCYTASPLATPTGITVSATTYPITVGGGGAGQPNCGIPGQGCSGSPSIFSTITSTGGGGGGGGVGPGTPGGEGLPGGSGGGAGDQDGIAGFPAGTGNTPPVSPPQGNTGGLGSSNGPLGYTGAGGGGGGAGATGGNAPGYSDTGNGGNGVTSSINGTPTARAGGGSGGTIHGPTPVGPRSGTIGSAGTGGGGTGSGTGNGSAASTNTGGGGGGAGGNSDNSYRSTGGNGGKGIIIIRYKFQN